MKPSCSRRLLTEINESPGFTVKLVATGLPLVIESGGFTCRKYHMPVAPTDNNTVITTVSAISTVRLSGRPSRGCVSNSLLRHATGPSHGSSIHFSVLLLSRLLRSTCLRFMIYGDLHDQANLVTSQRLQFCQQLFDEPVRSYLLQSLIR
ncbi:unannotated protein [freshwater metagenome]|uniref:Unannotated protein n=1 Tax=freshwater metagenome TaxID=449393 RepID=A0A6J7ULT9_9ZZZZ